MADNQLQFAWGTTTALDVTNLHSLASTNIWGSAAVNDATPTNQLVQISYNLVVASAMVAGDTLQFWVIGSDGDATTPYWPGSVAATQGTITTAATIAEAMAAVGLPHHQHGFETSLTATTFRGMFHVFIPRTDWKVLVRTVGKALASSGNVVRYRYANIQTVTV